MNMDYRRWTVVCTVPVASVVAIVGVVTGALVPAAIFVAIQIAVLAVLFFLTRHRGEHSHISHAEAQRAAGERDVIVYWMPGCIYCDLLKSGLGRARHDVSWVNILEDTEAARFVASHHDGDETVPTAVTGAGEKIDPTPARIKAQLQAAH